jgi:short-subunit dehydrogenase
MTQPLSPGSRLLLGLSSIAVGVAIARRVLDRRSRYSFQGRTAIITGGSRGLGLELARQLADEGARLWLVARSASELDAAAGELRQRCQFVETITADIRNGDDVTRVVETVLHADGRVDVLVNNAGIMEVSPFENTQREDYEDAMNTHFWAPLGLIQACVPHMRSGGGGRIINISSIGGRVALPHMSAYTASKFALTGLSESLHAELAKSGIAVTTVTPGLMRTGSYVNARLRGRHADEFRWFAAMSATPLTAMHARRAARAILEASRVGRAAITPGWQARAAQAFQGVAPNTFAAVATAADRAVLPRPAHNRSADQARLARDVDPGAVKAVLSEETLEDYHQPKPAWS